MIKETEHFILTDRPFKDSFGNTWSAGTEDGLLIKVKNSDGTANDLLYVIPNKKVKFMEDPGSHLETIGTMLQDTVTSWDLWSELIQLVDEADYRVGLAILNEDFNKYLD